MQDSPYLVSMFLGHTCTSLRVNEQSVRVCVNDRLGISGSLLSATYISVNRPGELQKGAKFCPISDL